MSRTYISGPISGMPNLNRAAFDEKARELARLGRDVVNPLQNGVPPESEWHEHMRVDIKLLLECSRIHLLPGWTTSKGARLEWWIAKQLGMEIEGAER